MALVKTNIGTTPDGRPLFHYSGEHVVLVGPITGSVTLPDGTSVDVGDEAVEAASPEQAAQIADAVATRYAEEGHPTDPNFTYTPEGWVIALASAAAENAALNGLDGTGSTNVVPFVSLHTASPSTTGANESASTPRQACSWNAASGGSKTNSSSLTFTTPGSTACTHFGTWSLVSAGTYAIGGALTSSVTAVTITVAAGALSIAAT